MMQSYDVTIVGGGIVGLTLAASLADSKLSIAVIENHDASALDLQQIGRVSAINLVSRTIFEKLNVWQVVNDKYLTAYDRMLVWNKDSAAKIDFHAQQADSAELGYIIGNQRLQRALSQVVQQQSNVTFYCPEQLNEIAIGDGEAWLRLKNGQNVTSKLLVAADGANSWVRNNVNIPLIRWDYDQHALVATVETELAHQHCARQVFTSEGPLAFLPLFEKNLCSIVWSVTPESAKQLSALSELEFNKQLTRAFDNRLGHCKVRGERHCFPLTMRYARDFAKHRVALIGDAAHTLHPLAGQGVNLGILDAISLAQVIREQNNAGKDIGLYENLRHFERWRKSESAQMIAAMELLKRLFSGNNPLQKHLQDIALLLADKLTPLKKQFIKQAMGLASELPEKAK